MKKLFLIIIIIVIIIIVGVVLWPSQPQTSEDSVELTDEDHLKERGMLD